MRPAPKELKTVEVKARMEPSLKLKAEKYFNHYQLSTSQAINLFFQNVVATHGLPFDLRPSKQTKEAMDELKKGGLKGYTSYEDMMDDIDKE